ncbi:hypothetical protein [Piscinibacter defluvii]|uniref:hypothetical protein n=1 Tax=Piscinibacter defluvii TaxID=1796922 RepID=UPI000FDEDDB0|nr:hypothetical protein [Piscinibacter defluvii]
MDLKRSLPILAAACLAPVLLWFHVFWEPSFSRESSTWSNFGSYIGGVLSPLLAFAAFVGLLITINQQRESAVQQVVATNDDAYFRHAVSCLERAFSTLSSSDQARRPVQDRLAWLTCARLLLSARTAARNISPASSGLRALYEGEEEHWRHQFYELLQPLSIGGVGTQAAYFQADGASNRGEIDERSIRVIYSFTEWPPDRLDPIDEVPRYTEAELDNLRVGMVGIRGYLLSQPRFQRRSGA